MIVVRYTNCHTALTCLLINKAEFIITIIGCFNRFYMCNHLTQKVQKEGKPFPNRALKETLLIDIPSASAIASTISKPTCTESHLIITPYATNPMYSR